MVWRYLILSALVVSAQIAYAENIALYEANELRFEKQNGQEKVFDKDGKAFNGAVILADEAGRQITYIYHNGQKDGIAVSRFANGKTEFETTYVKGAKNGDEMLFSADGTIQYKKTYKDDKLDGEYITFYANGKPAQKQTYSNNILNGESVLFEENGNIKHIVHYKNGQKDGVERIVENNILAEENVYKDGVLDGVSKKYNAKYLTDEISYKNGEKDGLHITYSAKGGKREVPYIHGKKSGVATAYFPDGKPAQRVIYVDDKRNGLAEKWDKNGVLRSTEIYKNNQKEGISRSFDEHGLLMEVQYVIDDTVLAKIDMTQHQDLSEIYVAFLQGVLHEYSRHKTNWYKILWLGLNTGDIKILNELAAQMKMYGYTIDDFAAYKKESGRLFEQENRQLFFGLNPLSYAVNLLAPVEILQLFATSPDTINALNARGTTALQEAVHLNNANMVKFLLLQGADTQNGKILSDAQKEHVQEKIIEMLQQTNEDINQLSGTDTQQPAK
ncbi:MAG: hypothetical protein J6N45_03295 [Alphaproteobacteria bacterium]|nr:hypothetical protein [Alphaproteobacteria bacterium]